LPVLNQNIAAIDETNIAEALTECCGEMDARLKRAVVQKSDHWHRRLLRTHRERPRTPRSVRQCRFGQKAEIGQGLRFFSCR
jgi:hypothetical protein